MKLKKIKYNQHIQIYAQEQLSNQLISLFIELFRDVDFNKYTLIRERKNRKVFKVEFEDQVYYIKMFESQPAKKRLKNLFRLSEAVRGLKKLYQLSAAQILVAEPVGAFVYRRGLFACDSILVTKDCKAITLQEYMKMNEVDQSTREKIFNNLAILWSKLFNHGFIHQDYNLSNFMIDTESCNLILADVDNIYLFPFLTKNMVIRNLAKFNARLLFDLIYNGIGLLTYSERILFFSVFLKHYRTRVDFEKFIIDVNRETINRLIEKGKEDVIAEDKLLTELSKKVDSVYHLTQI